MLLLKFHGTYRQAHLEKQQDRLVEEAKAKMQKKDKKGAMYCLKKKKMVQGQVDSIMGTMITLEQQKMALENAATCVPFQRSFYAFPLSFNVSSAFISLSTNLVFEFHNVACTSVQDLPSSSCVLGRPLCRHVRSKSLMFLDLCYSVRHAQLTPGTALRSMPFKVATPLFLPLWVVTTSKRCLFSSNPYDSRQYWYFIMHCVRCLA